MALSNDSNRPNRNRSRAGGAVGSALLLLVVAAGVLGWNYYRNYQIDRENEPSQRPFARFVTKDLAAMAEGYRTALAEARTKQIGGRVATRERHFLGDQIKEFERVQRESRRVRDRAIDVKEIQHKLDLIEAEQGRRVQLGGIAMIHLTRLFRI